MSSLGQMMTGLSVEKDGNPADNHGQEILIPGHFICPISLDLMKDPVILSSGITCDRDYIEKWFQAGRRTCPFTNQVLENFDLIPNNNLRKIIEDWNVQNNGMERIPTEKVPIFPSEILAQIQASSRGLDQFKCLESVQKIEKWYSESELNRLGIIDNGVSTALGVAFNVFANDSFVNNSMILEKILSALTWMFPLGVEDKKVFGSQASLRCMVWFLSSTDGPVKKNAVLLLQELSSRKQVIEALGDMEDVDEILFKLIKDQNCPTITKASFQVTKNLMSLSSSKDKIGSKFVEMGLTTGLLDIIIDSDRSLCEKALGVFDELCGCQKGIQEAYENHLTMPVLVNKLLRSSALATDYSVSAIWRLCENENENEEEVKAALEVLLELGAFQKLVLLLQVGCARKTKDKATKLLKLLNPLRSGKECIDPIDFRNLERSF